MTCHILQAILMVAWVISDLNSSIPEYDQFEVIIVHGSRYISHNSP